MPRLENIEKLSKAAAREFAADCAERVLRLFEQKHPGDTRPREAIAAARAYARGEIGDTDLAAAREAAWDAARAAAWAVTRACGDVAGAVAREAVSEAAWAAAWAASWDTAGAAAGAAAAAAEAAAGDDRDVWAAERRWQAARLQEYLDKDDTDTE